MLAIPNCLLDQAEPAVRCDAEVLDFGCFLLALELFFLLELIFEQAVEFFVVLGFHQG